MLAFLRRVLNLVRSNPVVLAHAVTAALTFVAAFGLSLDAKTTAEIMAGVQLVTALITRQYVSPVRSAPASVPVSPVPAPKWDGPNPA